MSTGVGLRPGLRKHRISHRLPTGNAPPLDSTFTSRGEIYVRDDVAMDETTRNALELAIDDRGYDGGRRRAILNLNHPTLVAARRAALDSERIRLRRDFERRTASRHERAARAAGLLGRGRLPAFVSIRVSWLRRTLGRGR